MITLEGVGKDAEIITNKDGGKQSKAISALHLIDSEFLYGWFHDDALGVKDDAIFSICEFMQTGNKKCLIEAIFDLHLEKYSEHEDHALIVIGKVLQEGAKKYKANNWRLIPQEEHINHALIHYIAYLMGDQQDDHIEHCMCRLMMAYATKKSEGFYYDKFSCS